jgi:hypothetical protein
MSIITTSHISETKLTELKGEIGKFAVIVGKFNAPLIA